MKNKGLVIGIVGVVVGFVLGFFVSQVFVQKSPRSDSPNSAHASSQLPENHPSPEMMEKLKELEAWVKDHPQDFEARIALGNLYYDMSRFDGAIRWYEDALKLQPSNVSILTDLGTAYLYTGNADKAVQLYEQSLALDPGHAQTLQNLGVAHFYTGKFAQALQYWEKLLEVHPNYPHRKEIEQQIQKAKDHLQKERS